MGQSDLDPRTIDLNLNVNFSIEIFYQCEYLAQVERPNYGTITACLRKGSAYRYKNMQEQGQDFTEMTSHEVWYIFIMNVSYPDNTKFIQFIEILLPVTKMKELFTLCLHIILISYPP